MMRVKMTKEEGRREEQEEAAGATYSNEDPKPSKWFEKNNIQTCPIFFVSSLLSAQGKPGRVGVGDSLNI